jgi:hypothetical protein
MNQQTVGSFYSNAVSAMNNPGSTYIIPALGNRNIYVPDPTDSMDCATIQANYQNLTEQITYWGNMVKSASFLNAPNLIKVWQNQVLKKKAYQPYVDTCNKPADITPANPVTEQTTTKKSSLPWLLLLGIGGAIIYKESKKSQRKTRKHGNK